MGILRRWRELVSGAPEELEPQRKLDLRSGFNVRELGGYEVAGGETAYRRFLRSGGLDMLSSKDQRRLYDYGVRLVIDLRGDYEVETARDRITAMPGVRHLHASLFDINISDPNLERGDDEGGYLTLGYLTMLGNHDAVRRIFSFCASATPDECVLFHCAAGMDRTGMTAMLLLGLAGASKQRIVADYCYSFGSVKEVDRFAFGTEEPLREELRLRRDAIQTAYDRLIEGYGSFAAYLEACGVTSDEMDRVRAHLLR